ncbi:taste receptor type 2 member 114-like [Astyanax mexicanus]|uniref:taste receptor type 2 member 114-like n=1 Tax=Astyanax mexicanus TaxID=7994 RepID=UPI0020CB31DE|nr:taste receptor type 2 member 114-like [Astyanax mexicanus]
MAENTSTVGFLKMSSQAFASVNMAVASLSIFINLFFVFCMVFPSQRSEHLKQPLNILLGLLIGSSIASHVCILIFVHSGDVLFTAESPKFLINHIVEETMLFIMRTSVTSHLWLNVFYYCQIVPAQRSFLIWLKDNIRVFVYFALIMDRLFFLSSFISSILYYSEIQIISNSTTYTNTSLMDTEQNATAAILRELSETCIIQYWLRFAYFFISLCVMLAASCATVLYLRRHMKRMEESSKSFSSPRLQKQMRVTITGIVQLILQMICISWIISDGPLRLKLPSHFDPDRHIYSTVISLYTLCSTLNLCVGQSIFRQRVINMWQNLVQFFCANSE